MNRHEWASKAAMMRGEDKRLREKLAETRDPAGRTRIYEDLGRLADRLAAHRRVPLK